MTIKVKGKVWDARDNDDVPELFIGETEPLEAKAGDIWIDTTEVDPYGEGGGIGIPGEMT